MLLSQIYSVTFDYLFLTEYLKFSFFLHGKHWGFPMLLIRHTRIYCILQFSKCSSLCFYPGVRDNLSEPCPWWTLLWFVRRIALSVLLVHAIRLHLTVISLEFPRSETSCLHSCLLSITPSISPGQSSSCFPLWVLILSLFS